jgi:heat shock protein HtpX
MQTIKRFGWFILVNMAVMIVIGLIANILMNVFGIGNPYANGGLDYRALMAICLIYGMTGAFISLAISRMMAKWTMGVKLVDPNSGGQLGWVARRVHELSRSAGLSTMPEVGVYESPDVNAFATGPTRSRSLVAVSTGLLHTMNEAEIEGVLAHEVAHIENGDMVTMTLIQGVVNAFVMFLARIIAHLASTFVKEEQAWIVRFVVTIVLDIAFAFLAMIIVSAFSRKREFRADAGAATLAGRQKMIAALEKLQQLYGRYDTKDEPASIAAFKISGGRSGGLMALFSTHPAIEDRIAALKAMR